MDRPPHHSTLTTRPRRGRERLLRPISAGAAGLVIFVSALALPLSAADSMGLTTGQRVGWIMGLYAIPGVYTLVLVARYRQPLLLTGNIFLLIFVASLGDQLPWSELVGASMLAGLLVLIMGPLGVTERLSQWLPPAIVYGLLAGAVLHFFVDLFDALDDEPILVGATLATYLLARRMLEPRVPALLLMLLVGVVLAAVLGKTGSLSDGIVWAPSFTRPELSWRAVLTVTPIMVTLMTVQANIPSSVLLRREGYHPPDSVIGALSGAGTTAGAPFGPIGLSLSLPLTALCAGPDAGDHDVRHLSAYLAGGGLVAIGTVAGAATAIATALPGALLATFVGIAVLNVLRVGLEQATAGPLVLGPLFAFGVVQSDLELAGLGPFFWALVAGIAVSMLLEAEHMPHRGVADQVAIP